MLHFGREGEVGEGAEGLRLGGVEILHEIAEDEFQRVISLRAGADEVQRIGEGEAVAAPELAGGPAQEERLTGGLAVEDEALGLTRARQDRIVGGEFGEGVERRFLAELFEDELLRAGADAPAAGEDGLAAGGQFFDEGEKGVALALEEAFEVVEDEEGLRAAQSVEEQARALVLGGLGDVVAAEFAGEFVEEFDKAGEDEAAEVAHAVVVQLAGLQGNEDDLFEDRRRSIVGRANGERGLAHPARPINERAPSAGVGIEGVGDLLQLILATEEGLERGEIVGDVGLEVGDRRSGGLRVVILGLVFVEGEAFEDELGELLGRFVVEFDESRPTEKAINLGVTEPAEHHLFAAALLEEIVNREPFQAGPFFRLVDWADNDGNEV